MLNIDLTSDLNEAMRSVDGFFWREVPYAMARTMNDSATDVQSFLRETLIPGSWTSRNKALPRAMTMFVPHAENPAGGRVRKGDNPMSIMIGPAMSRQNGRIAGEGFAERQVTGATKTPRGRAIAIPIEGPGLRRGAGGSIPAAKKPKNLRSNDKFFVNKKGNMIFERQRNKVVPRFVLAKQAKGTSRLSSFYPEAVQKFTTVFSGHFERNMNQAIASSRFFPVR